MSKSNFTIENPRGICDQIEASMDRMYQMEAVARALDTGGVPHLSIVFRLLAYEYADAANTLDVARETIEYLAEAERPSAT